MFILFDEVLLSGVYWVFYQDLEFVSAGFFANDHFAVGKFALDTVRTVWIRNPVVLRGVEKSEAVDKAFHEFLIKNLGAFGGLSKYEHGVVHGARMKELVDGNVIEMARDIGKLTLDEG